MTNDDVLGDPIPFDQQDAMRQFCYQTLKLGIGVGNSINITLICPSLFLLRPITGPVTVILTVKYPS